MPETNAIDSRALRHVLGRFATGVAIVTCVDEQGRAVGLTANSFSALSLEPPLVLWSLRQASAVRASFSAAKHFAVNVLGEAQVDTARRFAGSDEDKFSEGQWAPGSTGAPLLAACAAVIECETISRQIAGDHVLFIGRVVAMAEAPIAPLVFQAGHYRMVGEVL